MPSSTKIKSSDRAEYDKRTSARDRAQWLLGVTESREGSVTVESEVYPGNLTNFWQVYVAGFPLPVRSPSTVTPEEAMAEGLAWLRQKASGGN